MLVHPRATKFLPGQALVRYDLVKIHEDVHFRGSGNTASCWEVFVFWRSIPQRGNKFVDSSWNMMAHGDSREGKWRGNCRMRWVASTLHTTSEHVASSITNADSAHLGCQQSIELTPPPADLNRLVRFARKTKSGFCACDITFQLATKGWGGIQICGRVQLKCYGTRWRAGGEVKGKLANAVGSQYPSHYLGTWCIQHYYRWCAHLCCQ